MESDMSASFSTVPSTASYGPPGTGVVGSQEPAPFDPAAKAGGLVSDGTLDRVITDSFAAPSGEPAPGTEMPPGYVAPRSGYQTHEFGKKSFGAASAPNAPDEPDKGDRARGGASAREGLVRTNVGSGSSKVPTGMLYGKNYQQVGGSDANVDANHSAVYERKSSGDSRNGEKTVVEGGAWSNTATRSHADERGFVAAASASGSAGGSAEGGGSVTTGALGLDGNGKAYATAEGRVSAAASSSDETGHYVQAGLESRAAVGVEGASSVRLGPAEGGVGGKAMAGAESSTGFFAGQRVPTEQEKSLGITRKTGMEASVGAFAGAKAEGNAYVGINGSTVGVSGGAYVGVGADASANVGTSTDAKGKTYLDVGAKLGLAVGVGGSIGFNLHVDVTPVVKTGKRIGKACKSAAKTVKKAAKGAAKVVKAAANGCKKAGQKVGKFFKNLFS
jgi:hypothetical protein